MNDFFILLFAALCGLPPAAGFIWLLEQLPPKTLRAPRGIDRDDTP